MAFYKALENVELKKYSEATAEDFGVVFYSKGTFKTTKLFDKEVKKKVSAFFEDEKRSSLMISKEFSHLPGDLLFVRDFDTKKPDHKKEAWITGVFNQIDGMGVEAANVYADTSAQFKDCLLYTSPSPRDATLSRMPSSA